LPVVREYRPINLGIVIETVDAEKAWNAFRLGKRATEKGDDVSVFLLGEGVEAVEVNEPFDVEEKAREFDEAGGELLACGTCLEIREQEGDELCPVSTLDDLYEVIESSDRLMTVG